MYEENEYDSYNVRVSVNGFDGDHNLIGYVCQEHLHLLQGQYEPLRQVTVIGDWTNDYEKKILLTVAVSRADFKSFKYKLHDVRGYVKTCY